MTAPSFERTGTAYATHHGRIDDGVAVHRDGTVAAVIEVEGFPYDLVQRRKRLFFSIYMMDRYLRPLRCSISASLTDPIPVYRVVSIALGRPFALHDDDIDVEVGQ